MTIASSVGAWWLAHGADLLVSTALLLVAAEVLARGARGRVAAGIRSWLYVPVLLRVVAPSWPGSALGVTLPGLGLDPLWIRATEPVDAPVLATVVGVAWAAGVVVAAAPLIAGQIAVARLLRDCRPIGLRPGLRVGVHRAAGPMVVGLIRPTVVVPQRLLDTPALSHVLDHEAAHVARGDLLSWWALAAMRVAAWPVVPVWIAAHRILQLVEVAADERATRHAPASRRRAYGEALIAMAGPRPRVGVGLSTFHLLEERIMSLRRPVPRHPLAALAAVTAAVTLGLVACADPPQRASTADDVVVDGAVDPLDIDDAIRPHMPDIVRCYQLRLRHEPALEGRVLYGFTIQSAGDVADGRVLSSSLGAPDVESCVLAELEEVGFPEPQGGGSVQVTYPFVFEPG